MGTSETPSVRKTETSELTVQFRQPAPSSLIAFPVIVYTPSVLGVLARYPDLRRKGGSVRFESPGVVQLDWRTGRTEWFTLKLGLEERLGLDFVLS